MKCMIREDLLLQNGARHRHSGKWFWSSFDNPGVEAIETPGQAVASDRAQQFVSQAVPLLAAGLRHFGGEAQGSVQRAFERQAHRVPCGGMAAGGAGGLLHQQSNQVVGDRIHGDHFHRHGRRLGADKIHTHGGFDVIEAQLDVPASQVQLRQFFLPTPPAAW